MSEKGDDKTDEAQTDQGRRKFDNEHPVWRAVAFFVIAAAAMTYLVRTGTSAFKWLAPRSIRVQGDAVVVFDSTGKQLLSRRFGTTQDDPIYSWTPCEPGKYSGNIVLSHGDQTKNECLVVRISSRGEVADKYLFKCDNPYPDTFYDFQCSDLISFEYAGSQYYAAVFFGQRYPTAIVVLDHNLELVTESWHPGHIYELAWMQESGLLVGWGKNNTFIRPGIDDLIESGDHPRPTQDDYGTINHTCVFAIDFAATLSSNMKSLGVHGSRKPPPIQQPGLPYPRTSYAWYYIFSDANSDYATLDLQLKPNEGVVQFIDRHNLAWLFDQTGRQGPPVLRPESPRGTVPSCIEIVPVNHSEEHMRLQ